MIVLCVYHSTWPLFWKEESTFIVKVSYLYLICIHLKGKKRLPLSLKISDLRLALSEEEPSEIDYRLQGPRFPLKLYHRVKWPGSCLSLSLLKAKTVSDLISLSNVYFYGSDFIDNVLKIDLFKDWQNFLMVSWPNQRPDGLKLSDFDISFLVFGMFFKLLYHFFFVWV